MQIPEKRYFRPDEVAAALSVSIWTIYRRMKNGQIIHIHLNENNHRSARIPKDEYDRIVNSAK